MSTVSQLVEGDQIKVPNVPGVITGGLATFVAATQHPIWPHLQLVVWRMPDGSWSHDALDARQDVGVPEPADVRTREDRLRAVLLGEGAR